MNPTEGQNPAADLPALVVYGGGGHSKTIIELVFAAGLFRPMGIIDDHLPVGTSIMGLPVLGGAERLAGIYAEGVHLAANAVGGIGNVDLRINVFESIARAGFRCPALVHPSAWIEPSAVLADGVQILAKTYVSSEVQIGFGSVLNAGVVVSHDCRLGRIVNLSPGAMLAGGVVLEDYVQVGMAATINLNIHIGQRARVGNGATVKSDVPSGQVVRAGTIWPIPETQSIGRQA